jgi:DNA polymerase III epsilon subunit-like protein
MELQLKSIMFVDCQGLKSCGTKGHDVLFEICWTIQKSSSGIGGSAGIVEGAELLWTETVVRPSSILSPRNLHKVEKLCGIRPKELAEAPDHSDVAEAFVRDIERYCPSQIWIHYAGFERPFLLQLWETIRPGEPFPVPMVCTRDLARERLPELESYSLKAVAGYFGDPCDRLKRAGAHTRATLVVWRGLHDIDGSDDNGKPGKELRAQRLALPDKSGTYRFYDARGRILYIGKATSLKHRVNSYFRGGVRGDLRKREMMAQVKQIKIQEADSPLHAALDEFRGIVELAPPYNIAMKKDDGLAYWLARDSLLPEVSGNHPVFGPVGSLAVFSDIRSIAALASGAEPEKSLEAMFPGLTEGEGSGDTELKAGIKLAIGFFRILEESAHSPGAWLAKAVGASRRSEDRDELIEDPRGEQRDELPWDAECVFRSIRRKLKRGAAIYWHTAAVRLLCGAEVMATGQSSVDAPPKITSRHELQEMNLILSGIRAAFRMDESISVKLRSGRSIKSGQTGFSSRVLLGLIG